MTTVVWTPAIMSTLLNSWFRTTADNIVHPDLTRSLSISGTAIRFRCVPKYLKSMIIKCIYQFKLKTYFISRASTERNTIVTFMVYLSLEYVSVSKQQFGWILLNWFFFTLASTVVMIKHLDNTISTYTKDALPR